MEQKARIVSCIEYYSFLKNIPANKVFLSFQQASILEIILESNQSFPEMDTAFYAGMIDGIIAMERDADEDDFTHYKERTALVCDVVAMLEKKHGFTSPEACAYYYKSNIAALVSEDNTGFYQKTPAEIYNLIESES